MKGFENGAIIVKLSQRCVESDEKGVVDTGVANIVTECCNKQGQGVEWLQHGGDCVARVGAGIACDLVWRQQADLKQEIEDCLKDVDHVSEIVIEDEIVVCFAAGHDEDRKFV